MKHSEFELQKAVCRYLDMQYPNVLYISDTIANLKLTGPQQVRNKLIQKQGFKCPDLLILEPNKSHNGLFIELKTKSPYKKNGEIFKNDHLLGQQHSIDQLNQKGYLCCFAWGFEDIKKLIDDYIENKLDIDKNLKLF